MFTIYNKPVSDINNRTISIPYSPILKCDGNYGFTRRDCPKCTQHKIKNSLKSFQTITLDTLFPLTTIDWLKIDVEEAPFVLRGCENMFKHRRVVVAIVETVPEMWAEDETAAIYERILSYGYTIQCISFNDSIIYSERSSESFSAYLKRKGKKCIDWKIST